MTEDELKVFTAGMKKYALSRGSSKEDAEDFAADAWEKIYVRNWKSTNKQLYSDFIRNKLGADGSVKNRVEKAAPFNDETLLSESPSDDLPSDLLLTERTKMISILLKEGWSLPEISKAFALKWNKVRNEIEVELGRPQTRSAKILMKKKNSKALDIFNMMFG